MALIRCKKCGNPASSRSKACPICGEPIAQEVAVENTPTTAESASQSTPEPTSSSPKTLNDILAEGRASQPQTLNERRAATQESAEEPQPVVEPTPTKEESAAEPTPIVPPVVQYDYPAEDFNIDDVEEELRRRDRSVKGYKTAVIILALLLIPLTFFVVRYAGKVKSVEEDYALVESARKIFE